MGFTEEDTRNFVNKNMAENAKNFSVLLIDENILIGHIVFHKYFGDHTYEIGWIFNPKYYNKVYTSEAAQATLKYGFKEMGLHRIIATCQPQNTPSYRLMEKIGMKREGYFKKCIPHGKEWWDEYYYGILEEEQIQEQKLILLQLLNPMKIMCKYLQMVKSYLVHG